MPPPIGAPVAGASARVTAPPVLGGGFFGRPLLDLHGLATLVISARRTDAVRQLRLVAVIALDERRWAQRVVAASIHLTRVGDLSLGYTHDPGGSPRWRQAGDGGRADLASPESGAGGG